MSFLTSLFNFHHNQCILNERYFSLYRSIDSSQKSTTAHAAAIGRELGLAIERHERRRRELQHFQDELRQLPRVLSQMREIEKAVVDLGHLFESAEQLLTQREKKRLEGEARAGAEAEVATQERRARAKKAEYEKAREAAQIARAAGEAEALRMREEEHASMVQEMDRAIRLKLELYRVNTEAMSPPPSPGMRAAPPNSASPSMSTLPPLESIDLAETVDMKKELDDFLGSEEEEEEEEEEDEGEEKDHDDDEAADEGAKEQEKKMK